VHTLLLAAWRRDRGVKNALESSPNLRDFFYRIEVPHLESHRDKAAVFSFRLSNDFPDMEPPAKRYRVGPSPNGEGDDDDELFHEPEELNASRDPAVQLERSRAVATYRLKSSWETIFEKYSKDFTGVGDEIDIKTGEVVVDNGHIRSLNDADDSRSECLSDAGSLEEEQRILHGGGGGVHQPRLSTAGTLVPHSSYGSRLGAVPSFLSGPPRLSSMLFPSRHPLSTPMVSFGAPCRPSIAVESAWRIPELPAEAFESGTTTTIVARRVPVKSLPAPQDDDVDEDDILLGPSSSSSHMTSERSAVKDVPPVKGPPTPSSASGADGAKPTSSTEVEVVAKAKSPKSSNRKKHQPPVKSLISKTRGRRKTQVVISQDWQQLPTPTDSDTNGSEEAIASANRITVQHQIQPATGANGKTQLIVAIPWRPTRRGILDPSHPVPTSSELKSRPTRERKKPEYLVSISYPDGPPPREPRREDMSRALVEKQDSRANKTKKRARGETPRESTEVLPVPLPASDDVSQTSVVVDSETVPPPPPSHNPSVSAVTQPSMSPKPIETFSRNVVDPSYAFSDDDDDEGPTAPDEVQVRKSIELSNAQPQKPPQASPPTKKRKTQPVDAVSLPTIRESFNALTKHLPSAKATGEKILMAGKRALKKTLHTNGGASNPHDPSHSNSPNPRKRKEPPSAPQVEELPSPAKEPQMEELPSPPKALEGEELPLPAKETNIAPKIPPSRNAHGEAINGNLPVTPNRIADQKTPDKKPPSSSRISIMSLVSDGEEDELSLNFMTPVSASKQPARFNWSRPSPMAASAMRRITAMERRHRFSSHAKSSPLLDRGRYGPAGQVRRLASSPTAVDPDLVRTPGGSMRRCGEGGFRCERDFCFTCL
jgi:hypothetical protein